MICLGFIVIPFKPLSLYREGQSRKLGKTTFAFAANGYKIHASAGCFSKLTSVDNLAGVTNRHSELICEVPARRFGAFRFYAPWLHNGRPHWESSLRVTLRSSGATIWPDSCLKRIACPFPAIHALEQPSRPTDNIFASGGAANTRVR